ncbi:CPBP family intramembrane metalloprotease [Mucilaginibacter terrigena]|uniref:CPBP family intramembrane metalloprotease n=1 Tax=Mucilaginibacter terrigena TaxID=2492395 RepID=A0A4Q5LPZ6_9SPHI|nr:CPBP family glutamic-type intramembrane protease [Mucilaginibacter terrigena]RYU91484.1 CPBP family intramembrane metalloprotease [Mucilaginibacter terrigena]
MLKELFAISDYPSLDTERPFQSKFVLLLKIYGIAFLLNILSAPVSVVCDYLVTNVFHLKSIRTQYWQSMLKFFKMYGYARAIVYICIIAPVVEECIFRLPLTLKKQHIALALGFAMLLASRLIPGLQQQGTVIKLLVWAVLITSGYLIFNRFLPEIKPPGKRLQTRVTVISIIVFGLMHISNYMPLHWDILFIYPFYVLPQLFMGWFLTYIRFKNGFVWGIALHMLINSVSMLLYMTFKP